MILQRLAPGYTGLLWNLWPLGKAIAASARISAQGAPLPSPPDADAVGERHSRFDLHRRADVGIYLALTDGSDLRADNPDLLPPLYFLTWSLVPYLELISSDELSLSLFGILHVQNDLIVHRPITRQDRVDSKVYVERIQGDAQRSLIAVRSDSLVEGELRLHMRTMLFAGATADPGNVPEAPVGDLGDPAWTTIAHVPFASDLGRRYACLTGDINPIHLSPLTSRLFGLERPIAHGFCVKATMAHALVRHLGHRRFDSLRRLRVRFRAPVPLPSTAVCQIRDNNVRLLDRDRSTIYVTGRYQVKPAD